VNCCERGEGSVLGNGEEKVACFYTCNRTSTHAQPSGTGVEISKRSQSGVCGEGGNGHESRRTHTHAVKGDTKFTNCNLVHLIEAQCYPGLPRTLYHAYATKVA